MGKNKKYISDSESENDYDDNDNDSDSENDSENDSESDNDMEFLKPPEIRYNELNSKQKKVLKMMQKFENIFISGFQETGKTTILQFYIQWLIKNFQTRKIHGYEINIISDLEQFDDNYFNIIIFDEYDIFNSNFVKSLYSLFKKNQKKRNFQIIIIAESHTNYNITIGHYFMSASNKYKSDETLKKLFNNKIHFRRSLNSNYHLRFEDNGSCDS